MFRSFFQWAMTIGALAGIATDATAQQADRAPRDGVMRLKSGDPAMARAILRARAGLNDFLSLAENPDRGQQNFSVKIGIPVGNDVEYAWVRPFSRDGDGFKGRLVNDVAIMPNLAFGQWVGFDEVNIVDWSYVDGERVIGNQTGCALMRTLPLAEQAAFKQRYRLTCDP